MANNKKINVIQLKNQAMTDITFYKADKWGFEALIADVIRGYEEQDTYVDIDEYAYTIGAELVQMTEAAFNKIDEV